MTQSLQLARGQAQFVEERNRMVDRQIASRGIIDPRVLTAMRRVPRHLFVPKELYAQAYEDHPVQIGQGQTISQPYMVAIMTQSLELQAHNTVLEIGTGSGYQTAILAELAASVVTVERNKTLAEDARQRLASLGYVNISVVTGDGTLGYLPNAPYDGIVVTAAGPCVPDALRQQLNAHGRLVCPAGTREMQTLIRIRRHMNDFEEEDGINCIFVPLIGKQGWPET